MNDESFFQNTATNNVNIIFKKKIFIMANDLVSNTDPDNNEQIAAQDMPLNIHAQYIRDLSFENPNAPESLKSAGQAPEMDLNIGMDARKIPDDKDPNLFEVILSVSATAKRNDKETLFIAELQYGVTVSIAPQISEENHHPLLLIEVPRLAFPFVRQIISDATIQGGFPPLMLNPVDFHALYMQRFGQENENTQKQAVN